jgi:hypothetical protein
VDVRWRDVDEDDVEWERARLEEPWDVRQEDRHIVSPTLVDGRSRIWTDEQRPVPEVAGHLRGEVQSRALDVEVDNGDVP